MNRSSNIFILVIIFSNFLFSSSFSFGTKSILKNQINYQDTMQDLEDEKIKNLTPYNKSFKSPGKALLYSAALPGLGQFYMEKWKRGLLFISLDAIAIGTWYNKNKLAEVRKREYVSYADEHWSLARWIHDYYKWYEYRQDDENWNLIREVFINSSDSTYGCAQADPPGSLSHCYVDMWAHSHSVEFTWNGSAITSNCNTSGSGWQNDCLMLEVIEHLCDNNDNNSTYNAINNPGCFKALEEMNMIDEIGDTIIIKSSHHFYEGIQKYDMFFAGWDDNDSVAVVVKNVDKNAISPHKIAYRAIWSDYNSIKTIAGNGGKFMLINRVISMVDALLLAKKWNNEHGLKLSLTAYPNLRNKLGIGSIRLSFYFK